MSRRPFTIPHHPFTLRLVLIGERYGRDNCLTHGASAPSERHEPLVEFWDGEQFVSRYYLSTLLDPKYARAGSGLALDCGVLRWTVTADGMDSVRDYLRGVADALTPNSGANDNA